MQTCEDLGIGFVPWGPLGQGFLPGTMDVNTQSSMDPKNDLRATFPRFSHLASSAFTSVFAAGRQGVLPYGRAAVSRGRRGENFSDSGGGGRRLRGRGVQLELYPRRISGLSPSTSSGAARLVDATVTQTIRPATVILARNVRDGSSAVRYPSRQRRWRTRCESGCARYPPRRFERDRGRLARGRRWREQRGWSSPRGRGSGFGRACEGGYVGVPWRARVAG